MVWIRPVGNDAHSVPTACYHTVIMDVDTPSEEAVRKNCQESSKMEREEEEERSI